MEEDFISFKLWKQIKNTAIYISESGGCVTKNLRTGFCYPRIEVKNNLRAHSHYPQFNISYRKNNKIIHFHFCPHRAVAFTYLPIPSVFHTQVDHLDGNIFNNNLWNLEWVTPEENMRRAKEARKRKEKEAEDKRDQEILAYYETHRYTGD